VVARCRPRVRHNSDVGSAPRLRDRHRVPDRAARGGVEIANDDDEDAVRRGSIALVLGEVNRALTQAGESAPFFQFADDVSGWETDEPVWLLLTDDERDQLVADGTLRSVPAS